MQLVGKVNIRKMTVAFLKVRIFNHSQKVDENVFALIKLYLTRLVLHGSFTVKLCLYGHVVHPTFMSLP